MKHISFIVPLFNHLDASREMLVSLQRTLPPELSHEILLIDDGSTDGTREWLQGLKDRHIKPLFNPANLGYAAANNRAVASARGEILGLLNNDLVFTPGWLEPMLAALEHPSGRVGLVGNLQYRVADGALDHAGVELLPSGQFAHIRHLPDQPAASWPVEWVTGACLLIRKADFEAVGGFDEGFRNGGEDFDLCFALRRRRQTIRLAAASRIRHHVSLSRGKTTAVQERNSRRLFQKWRSVIKGRLTEHWVLMLRTGEALDLDLVSGELSPPLRATPHAGARLIAENLLRRQEARWRRELDDPPAEPARPIDCWIECWDRTASAYRLSLRVSGLDSCRNVYVCGIRTGDRATRPKLKLSIEVNGFQRQEHWLGPENTFNLGIRHPLILPEMDNRFLITIESTEAAVDSARLMASLQITHVVIDDQTYPWTSHPP